MTKEEKQTLETNNKLMKESVERLDRICRQIQILNLLKAKELGVDIKDMILENDHFETAIKRHGYEKKLGRINKAQKEETENA